MSFQSSSVFDVIVVGAGHAGCEAALASARMGLSTALLTMNPDTVAKMSCNPAIGGLAKGHLVREIDALGGQMAKTCDATSIQSKILNRTQGPAVWGYRAQADKELYNQAMRATVFAQANLTVKQALVERLLVAQGEARGVLTQYGEEIRAKAVVITTGTFLNALMHIGETKIEGGRTGELTAKGLSAHLRELGFEVGRLKTGTNPRVNRDSIDFSKTEEQRGDADPQPFSHFTTQFPLQPQIACHITYTNDGTHQAIRDNMARSPLYSGVIKGIGPRYCPSIEDKVVKFPDKNRHQIFLEPEGLSSNEYYLNGLSTSLPLDAQYAFLRTIPGLERAEIVRPGYAVEYDFVPPTQVRHSLETYRVKNLFLAGQINGTSGYEEAAAQGLMAGLNAALAVKGLAPFVLSRTESYIGVLIDDLVTKGTEEPYRLFTSKAEYRLLLRPDNADLRLMEKGHELGLIPRPAYEKVVEKKSKIEAGLKAFKTRTLPPEAAPNEALKLALSDRALKLEDVIRRPWIRYEDLRPYLGADLQLDPEVAFQVEVELKYEGYLRKQRLEIDRQARYENLEIPRDFPYLETTSFSREAKEKLNLIRPETFGQASRIQGVTPADLSVLLLALSRFSKNRLSSLSPEA
ncbi:MAG TPA: tRNA uridine-5-carboxymethylaminomethyl(34) synthesis enzyme MnmG [bacterium]|nr:tRNA uridine-5-carboxymethylaminomethyl(34) synthesis enzyme MnmG [bacterium]